jgi:2-polyprenyl-3-methyl-5-hydroxy-6-metoxy-1,4-benzoquinol methylase
MLNRPRYDVAASEHGEGSPMSASKYDTDVDPDSNSSHALMLRLVGANKKVLDVGCASGYLARALGERGCRVSGVEFDPAAAQEAAPALEKIVVGDLDEIDLPAEFAGSQFDVVVFGDVLEHLRNPLPLLRSVRGMLAPGGAVVISVPNIAHGDVRLSLLQGRFDYRDLGLLDSTHIRFFTRESLRSFLEDAGFIAVDVQTTTADLLTTELADTARGADPAVIERLRDDIDATTYQFVVRAVRDDAVQLAADAAWRSSEMEKQLVATRDELQRLEAELAAAQDTAEQERARAQAAEEHVTAMMNTKAMRGMRLPRAVWSRLRGGRRPAS